MENNKYMQYNCPECGAQLEVYYEGQIEEYPGKPWDFVFGNKRCLIRHCHNCHCDWENEFITLCGLSYNVESELKRKFWG